MAYILLSENCKGSRIKFSEENGEFFHRAVGKNYSGTLALQTFEDRDYMRITFADTKNVIGGAVKKLFGITSAVYNDKFFGAYKKGNADYLCHFDFSEKELYSGKKKITYSMQMADLMVLCVLTCYDFEDYTGCCYMFTDADEAKKWAMKLGVAEVELLDRDGRIINREPLK